MNLKPIRLAVADIASSMFFVNGFALDTGMLRIDLPCIHFRASNGGPGATNSGSFLYGSICFLKYSTSSASAAGSNAPKPSPKAARKMNPRSRCLARIERSLRFSRCSILTAGLRSPSAAQSSSGSPGMATPGRAASGG